MIHAPNINTLWTSKRLNVHGDVDIKVYDPEDMKRMEPKVDILDTNVVKDDLLEKLNDEMHTNSDTNTAHQLHTGTNWHPASDMCYSPDLCSSGYTITSNREGENGISVAVTGNTGQIQDDPYGGCTQCKGFCLYENTSTSTTNNASTWAAEATWLSGYDPNTTTVERMYMGKNFDTNNGGLFINGFSGSAGPYAFAYAYYDNTNFSIQTLDILRVTWTITVG